MNRFGRFFSRLMGTGTDGLSQSRVVYTGRTAAGVYVDADTALKNATVWACVQYLTRAVGQLPWHVMQRDKKGNATIVASNPADRLLNSRPCADMGAFSWRQVMLGQALLRGNAYAEIQWDNRGAPYALWPIHPDRVCVRRDDNGDLEYEVWNRNGNSVLPAADMIHIRGYGDGAVGYSVIAYAAQSIGWAQATELFGSTYFGEGMNPSLVVEVPATTKLSPEGLKVMRDELNRLYKGPKGERTFIADAGNKVQKLSNTPEDSQFIETRQHQIDEICRWFGVPPHKVQNLLRATFSNIEHQSIEVVQDSLSPWVRVFEQEVDYKLFGSNNRQGLYTKMSLQALLRGDNASRLAFYKGMFELGMTINQILALEDLNGIGPEGDVPFTSNNVQTLDRAINGPQPAAGAVAEPPLPPPTDDGAANGTA